MPVLWRHLEWPLQFLWVAEGFCGHRPELGRPAATALLGRSGKGLLVPLSLQNPSLGKSNTIKHVFFQLGFFFPELRKAKRLRGRVGVWAV